MRLSANSSTSVLPRGLARGRLLVVAFIAAFVALGVTGACSKSQDRGPARDLPEPVDPAEGERGEQACEAYVAQLCACAESRPDDPELAEACRMAPAKLSSLAAVLEVNRTSQDLTEIVSTERTARKIMGSCIEEQARLLGKGCRPPSEKSRPETSGSAQPGADDSPPAQP